MATTGTNNPAAILKTIDLLEAGTTKDIVGNATVTVQGVAMTAKQIVAKLAAADTLYAAVTNARVAEKTALAAWEAALPGFKLFVKAYKAALKGQFGPDSVQLLDFGINPLKKPAPRTTEEKAVSAALARQTRVTRGTKGKNQTAATTTQGKPGLGLFGPTGAPIPGGLVTGPTPPGSSEPVTPNVAPAGSSTGGSTPGSGGSSTPPASGGSTPTK
jgi:hypothetical protein